MDAEHNLVVHKGEVDQVCSVGLYFQIDHLMKQEYNWDVDYAAPVSPVKGYIEVDC